MDSQNYYEILGVDRNAPFYSIRQAKDELKFGDSNVRVPFSKWAIIDEAYSVLSDPEKRKEYDQYLDSQKNVYENSEKNEEQVEEPVEYIVPTSGNNKDDESLNNGHKLKIQKDVKVRQIKGLVSEELSYIREYEKVLSDEIEKLINSKSSIFRLQILLQKYKNQIELLYKMLDIRSSRKSNSSLQDFKNKLEIISIENELIIARKNYERISSIVLPYIENKTLSLFRS